MLPGLPAPARCFRYFRTRPIARRRHQDWSIGGRARATALILSAPTTARWWQELGLRWVKLGRGSVLTAWAAAFPMQWVEWRQLLIATRWSSGPGRPGPGHPRRKARRVSLAPGDSAMR